MKLADGHQPVNRFDESWRDNPLRQELRLTAIDAKGFNCQSQQSIRELG
jgi:hypothetical protein